MGASGIVYVVLATLKMRGITLPFLTKLNEREEEEEETTTPNGYADLLSAAQEPAETQPQKTEEAEQVDLDSFFKS